MSAFPAKGSMARGMDGGRRASGSWGRYLYRRERAEGRGERGEGRGERGEGKGRGQRAEGRGRER
jgi:hypothetical protein